MKKRTLEFNLAELTEHKLTGMLADNQAGIPEVMALLEGLFDMWSSALKFSMTAVNYGETLHPDFLEMFVSHASHNHGIAPERLREILKVIGKNRRPNAPSSSGVH